MRSSKRFKPDFKKEATEFALANADRPLVDLAKELGVGKSTLSKWVHDAQLAQGKVSKRPLTEEQQEIRALKKEVAHLREVNEILKKATAYFAAPINQRGTLS